MSESIYGNVVEVTRRTMVLFFLVDTSGSMAGSKMGTVNTAIEEVVPELKDISEHNADAQIKIAALAFSTGAHWLYNIPVSAENFKWTYMDAGGVTDFGEACNQLNDKLSMHDDGFMTDVAGSYAPAIFLMSDGEPTSDYTHELEQLKQNSWFRKAIKVAIAIGDDANQAVLADFTGTTEAVITTHTPGELKRWIQFVSVRASEIASKSSNVGTGSSDTLPSKQDDFVQEIKQQTADAADWSGFDDGVKW